MPSQPKFRETFEQEQQTNPRNISRTDNSAGQENQQNQGQWGEDRGNTSQNLSDTDNAPVNQHGRSADRRGPEEVPMENDTPVNFPEKGGNQQF